MKTMPSSIDLTPSELERVANLLADPSPPTEALRNAMREPARTTSTVRIDKNGLPVFDDPPMPHSRLPPAALTDGMGPKMVWSYDPCCLSCYGTGRDGFDSRCPCGIRVRAPKHLRRF